MEKAEAEANAATENEEAKTDDEQLKDSSENKK